MMLPILTKFDLEVSLHPSIYMNELCFWLLVALYRICMWKLFEIVLTCLQL